MGTTAAARVTAHRTAKRSPDGLRAASLPVLVQPWDGTAEIFYRSPQVGQEAEFIQLFTLPEDSGTINEVTACFAFDLTVIDFTYEVLILQNSGGSPGPLIAATELFVDGAIDGDVCLTGEVNVATSSKRVFVGIFLPDVGDTFFGVDTNGPFTTPGFYRLAPNDPWTQLPDSLFQEYQNLALELEFTDASTPPPASCPVQTCVSSDETLCLQGDRFKVTADFLNQFDDSGPMKAGPEITQDTGYFHFPGTPANVEVVLKVLDACVAPFDRFWVFAGGLTDQEVTVDVCDTDTGVLKTYFNALNTPFLPITDTEAFATCP